MSIWALEIEEIDHITKILKKLKNDEDKNLILLLVERVSSLSGWKQAVEEQLKKEQK